MTVEKRTRENAAATVGLGDRTDKFAAHRACLLELEIKHVLRIFLAPGVQGARREYPE